MQSSPRYPWATIRDRVLLGDVDGDGLADLRISWITAP